LIVNNSIIFFLLFSAIFLGGIHPSYQLFIDYYDIFLVISFLILFFRQKVLRSSYDLYISKYDIIFILLIIFCSVPALLLNNQLRSTQLIVGIFYPIRLYLSYKVFTYLFNENQFSISKKFIKFFDILIIFSLISGLSSLLRYLPNGIGLFIDNTWPIISNKQILPQLYWGRLWGTMGGTNTAGNYFTILSLFTFYRYQATGKRFYIFQFFLFTLCVLMSLSFGSIIGFLFGMFLLMIKFLKIRSIFITSFIGCCLFFIAMSNELFYSIIEKRIFVNWSYGGLIPENLVSRTGYWIEFTKIMFEGPHFFYGNGPGGLRGIASHGNPESFYFRIFNESGFIGIVMFIILFLKLFKQINFIKKNNNYDNHFSILRILLLVMLVMCVSAETFYSNGVSQIFILILTYVSTYYNRIKSFP